MEDEPQRSGDDGDRSEGGCRRRHLAEVPQERDSQCPAVVGERVGADAQSRVEAAAKAVDHDVVTDVVPPVDIHVKVLDSAHEGSRFPWLVVVAVSGVVDHGDLGPQRISGPRRTTSAPVMAREPGLHNDDLGNRARGEA